MNANELQRLILLKIKQRKWKSNKNEENIGFKWERTMKNTTEKYMQQILLGKCCWGERSLKLSNYFLSR